MTIWNQRQFRSFAEHGASTVSGPAVGRVFTATHGAAFFYGVDRGNGMGREGVSLVRSWGADEADNDRLVGRATAESSATGCSAGHDRITSVHSQSSLVSRWRRRSGPGTAMSLLQTIRPHEQAIAPGQGWAGHPSHSRRLFSLCSFGRVPARDRSDDATRWASRNLLASHRSLL